MYVKNLSVKNLYSDLDFKTQALINKNRLKNANEFDLTTNNKNIFLKNTHNVGRETKAMMETNYQKNNIIIL